MTACTRRALAATVMLLAGSLGLAACSGGASGSPKPTAAPSSTAASSPGTGGGPQRVGFAPAAQGEIAAISGHTLQVQSTSDQTAVTYTAKTAFTAERTVSLSAIKVGSCIVAMSSSASRASDPLTATTVRVTAASGGNCTGGFGAGRPNGRVLPSGAARPSRFPTGERPSGFPTGLRRSGVAGGGNAFGGLVAGKVTAVSGATITVAAAARAGASSSGSTSSRTVQVTSKTTYTTTGTATSSALRVGLCAVVTGKADTTGTVAATRIALSNKVNGTCTQIFGGRRG
jgi:hypothetical protein